MTLPATNLPTLLTACVTSPLGDLRVTFSDAGDTRAIHAIEYMVNCKRTPSRCSTSLPADWSQRFLAYFSGDLAALDDITAQPISGTDFQQSVWLALQHIPAGQTWTYKDIAAHIDRPKAMRAVGQALSKNPLPIILPCHRIIKSSGKLGGYAGSSELGSMRKRYLLWHEGQLDTEPQELF